ncbi:MAG: hypothetical protein HY000_34630, partial [Planctomycetes bacterium]|nr:hypothetical protein [Planctomycetota bacterium]
MSMTDAYPQLMDELSRLRHHWRVRKLTEGALLALAATTTALVATVAGDNLLKLGTGGRTALCLVLWGAAIASVAVFIVQRWLEDRRDDFFAAMVEARHPELGNKFINALQLGRSNGFGSPRLVEAIVHDAAEATADMELIDCLDSRLLRRNAYWVAGATGVLVLYASVFSARFGNGLKRVLLPVANIAPYTATQVAEVQPGNQRFLEGSPIAITASVTGTVPRDCRLYHRRPDGAWQHAAMGRIPESSDRFQFAIAAADATFEYFVQAGDGRSETFRADIVERPQITGIVVEYVMPPYTGIGTRRVEDSNGDLHAIPGTTVRLEFIANKPLRKATLAASVAGGSDKRQGPPEKASLAPPGERAGVRGPAHGVLATTSECTRGSDDRHWLVSLPITGSGTYQVKLTDTEGFDDLDPVRHPITLARDVAPTVTITTPGRDLQVKPDQSVPIAIQARDDYGLAELRLRFKLNN